MKTLNLQSGKFILALYLCTLCFNVSFAQQGCGSDVMYEHLLRTLPNYEQDRNSIEDRILETSHLYTNRSQAVIIPVVVHILHHGEPIGEGSNISNQRVIDALESANQKWNDESGLGANMNVQFCLVKTDPNGNETTGITRTNASAIQDYTTRGMVLSYEHNSNEIALKNLNNWPHDQYYNIWVVSKFNAGWGGYAYFPSTVNYDQDGTTIVYHAMKSESTLLSHELGHGFNLYHTFNGDNGSCPENDNCATQGDKVCDTPPHKQSGCAENTCSSGNESNSLNNYMSYCGGLNMFTEGQKTRVHAALANTTRAALVGSNLCAIPCSSSETVYNTTCQPNLVGTTTNTYTNASGCDSVVTEVTTYQAYDETIIVIPTCNSEDVGEETESYVNQYGCDSFVVTSYQYTPLPKAEFTYFSNGLSVTFENTSEFSSKVTWSFGDGTYAGNQNMVTHTFREPGNYDVQLMVDNDCGSDAKSNVVNLSVLSTNNLTTIDDILLSPNPSKGNFNVELKGQTQNEPVNLSLFDPMGRLVDDRMVSFANNYSEQYQLETVSKGIYFLRVAIADKVINTIPVAIN